MDRDEFNDRREYYDDSDYEPDLPSGYCKNCGKQCTAVLEDHGIGSYEFWGAKGTDVQMVAVSPCCSEDVAEVQLPCHADCIHFDDIEHQCMIGIPEEKVDGCECEKFSSYDLE